MSLFCSHNCHTHWGGGIIHQCWLGPKPNLFEIFSVIAMAAVFFPIIYIFFDWGFVVSLIIVLIIGVGSFVVCRVFLVLD